MPRVKNRQAFTDIFHINKINGNIVTQSNTIFVFDELDKMGKIIEKDKTIRIKTSKGMKFYSFNDVKEVVEKDGTIIWSYKAYNIREEQRKRNTCLYGIAGIAVIYFLILDNLLEDFTMDPND